MSTRAAADDDSEQILLEQRRDCARLLLGAVGGDLDALRARRRATRRTRTGRALCEDVADAVRQLIAQLDADLSPRLPSQPSTQVPRSTPQVRTRAMTRDRRTRRPGTGRTRGGDIVAHAGQLVPPEVAPDRAGRAGVGLVLALRRLHQVPAAKPGGRRRCAAGRASPSPEKLPHGGYDVPLNRLIGWGLQPLGAVHRCSGRSTAAAASTASRATRCTCPATRRCRSTRSERSTSRSGTARGSPYIDYEVDGKTGRLKLDDLHLRARAHRPDPRPHPRRRGAGGSESRPGDADETLST